MNSSNTFNLNLNTTVDGWEDVTVYEFHGPQVDGTPHVLILTVDRKLQDPSLKDFVASRVGAMTDGLQNIDKLKDEQFALPGGLLAHELVFKWTLHDKAINYKKAVFVVAQGMGLFFSCDFTRKSFKLLNAQANTIIEAIALTQASSQPSSSSFDWS